MKNRIFISIYYCLLIAFAATSVQSQVVINEIMYHPPTLSDDDEYVELFNAGTEAVDLSGWAFVDGIDFIFPPDASLAAGGYAVVCASPESFEAQYGRAADYGPFHGKFSNRGEQVELIDRSGRTVEKFEYSDELGWPANTDGLGASMERINPLMTPDHPGSWSFSPFKGTPGEKNSTAVEKPIPLIDNVNQTPSSPRSNEEVWISARVRHSSAIESVHLLYKTESESEFQYAEMADDGEHHDLAAGDGVYGASIPPHGDGAIVEFKILALDAAQTSGWFPTQANAPASIYRVDDSSHETSLPIYKIILRKADNQLLRSRDPNSNDELSGSFVYGSEIYHNVLIRFRGKGSRHAEPKSYRVNFSQSRYFGSIRKMDLNAQNVDRQYIGLEVFRLLNMPAPNHQFVAVDFNGVFIPQYIQVERTDQDMMERLFGDGNGNLYRGIEQANLDYRGEDFGPYIPNYSKLSHELEADYSDIVDLCDAFSNSSDADFPDRISQVIHVREWIRWFAVKEVLNDMEGGLSLERGDDYYIYRKPNSKQFYLLPWDQDSVLRPELQLVHHHGTPAVQRLLRHPDFAWMYYDELLRILQHELPLSLIETVIDQTSAVNNAARREELLANHIAMREFILPQIPQQLTAQAKQGVSIPVNLVNEDDEWRFFRGKTSPGSNWTAADYDDSGWETGPGGFGYGDDDDRTVLDDMRNSYSTVFIRKEFSVENADALATLKLHINYDDGFAAYINGIEAARSDINGTPDYRTQATRNREADGYQDYDVNPSLLHDGRNVIAIIGANVDLSSSDLSLAPNLIATFNNSSILELLGDTDASRTRWVHVNGQTVDYTPWLGKWAYYADLPPGRYSFKIETFDAAGLPVNSTQIAVYHNIDRPEGIDEIIGDVVWRKADNPHVITKPVVVLPGSSLTVEAGAEVRLSPEAGITVNGSLLTAPHGDEMVTFYPINENETWKGIEVDHAAGAVTIRNASFTGVGSSVAIHIASSTATVEQCEFFDMGALGVEASASNVWVRGCTFRAMAEAVHGANSFMQVEHNLFENIKGYNDAIDFDYEGDRPSIIAYNTILGTEDDGIDLGFASTRIYGNRIQGCADKGISLEGASTPWAANNIVWNCNIGVAVKDSCQAQLIHNTIIKTATGVYVYEKNDGQGGASVQIKNCVIWSADFSIAEDGLSTASAEFSDLNRIPPGMSETNISVDPLFAGLDTGDFTPLEGSPLIDAAADSEIVTDIHANPRPIGGAPDIGAIETAYSTDIRAWETY
ncbi:MAG: hypothetical protein GC154_12235 [bacterium]|nr:hypothetical protein [bacterium]